MATIDLKQLVGRLNDVCRRALEAAAGMTLSRTHYNVEIEHWLLALADRADCDGTRFVGLPFWRMPQPVLRSVAYPSVGPSIRE